jgi:uroporphyrinogen decarboxylase
MTSRERFLTALHCEKTDRRVRYEHGPWPSTQERWRREGYPAGADFGRYFQMDPLVRIMIQSGFCDSPYFPKFEETTLEETAACRVYRDGDGIVKKELKTGRDTSMPQFLKFPVASRADWAELRRRLRPEDAAARIGDPERLRRLCADPATPTMLPICGAFGHPRNLLGDEGLAYVIFDDPALLDEILENWLELYIRLLREVTRVARVDALLIWEDMCYKNGPLISPEHFRRFMLTPYRKLVAAARACGIGAVLVDTDGDCRKMAPLFVEAGVDCLLPFEVQAGMDLAEIHAAFPGLCILGGIDKRALAEGRRDIKQEVDRVLRMFAGFGGYIPTLDHTVPPNVSLDNFK